ncbi:MAG: hypothetical protein HC837_13430 [Chloroflexaceae bacterium]|nr:hypothetical protein [Chloroflexaceae bacterium]
MENLLLIIGLAAVIILTALVGWRFWQRRQAKQQSKVIDMKAAEASDGTVVAQQPQPDGEHGSSWVPGFIRHHPILVTVVVLLAVLALGSWLQTNPSAFADMQAWLLRSNTNELTVVVVPFDDGNDGQTGRNIGEELAQTLDASRDPRMVVTFVDQRPANEAEVLALAEANRADVLIWGSVPSGETLNRPTLQPRLVYAPNGVYAPNALAGYRGRFAMPMHLQLTQSPVNGAVVLPPLMSMLTNYH